jgi:hypothetical protein
MGSARWLRHAARAAALAALLGGCVSRQDDPFDGPGALPLAVAQDPAPVATTDAAPAARPAIDAEPPQPLPAAEAAAPAHEEITVVGHSFTGLWKVSSPKRIGMDVGLFSGVHIRYSGEVGDRDLCELRQTGSALDARCLRLARTVSGDVDGDRITLRSWIGPANLVLKASTAAAGTLAGTIGGGAFGTQLTGGVPVRATRIAAPVAGGDRPSALLVRAVLADVATGRLTPGRYAPEAAARLEKDLDELRTAEAALGPLRDIAYLDQLLPRHPYDPRERPLEVYRVDYARGSQLCGISPGPPAAVADFICR